MCNHMLVDGFGGMGDAVVCCLCGLDKYPEAIPVAYAIAKMLGRVITDNHPRYEAYVKEAQAARSKSVL